MEQLPVLSEISDQTIQDVIHPESNLENTFVTAFLPHEMTEANEKLIQWCEKKISVLKLEEKESLETYEHAKKMKWKQTPFKTMYYKIVKQVSYYEKMKTLLEEGYYIVPNFPITSFAIRTNKTLPAPDESYSNWRIREQDPQELVIGLGDYKNPFPVVRQKSEPTEKDPHRNIYWNDDWDEFEFPVNMAKPNIMKATSEAMDKKIFDRIGVMPSTRKKEDPVIIGQIINKRNQFSIRVTSFMIAWHLDTRTL